MRSSPSLASPLLAVPALELGSNDVVFSQEEIAPLSKEERKQQNKKRKAANAATPRTNTAVYVSNLPTNPPPSVELISQIFSKAGLILPDPATNEPRIKFYYHDDSEQSAARRAFKGEALVVYLQPESVQLAVRLFDQTELELGSGKGLISVQEAKWDNKKKEQGENGEGPDKKKPKKTPEEKSADERAKKLGKKAAALRQ